MKQWTWNTVRLCHYRNCTYSYIHTKWRFANKNGQKKGIQSAVRDSSWTRNPLVQSTNASMVSLLHSDWWRRPLCSTHCSECQVKAGLFAVERTTSVSYDCTNSKGYKECIAQIEETKKAKMADESHIKSELNRKKLKMKYVGSVQHNTTYIRRHDICGDKPVISLAARLKLQFMLQINGIPSSLAD
jgi:hypothetical protein